VFSSYLLVRFRTIEVMAAAAPRALTLSACAGRRDTVHSERCISYRCSPSSTVAAHKHAPHTAHAVSAALIQTTNPTTAPARGAVIQLTDPRTAPAVPPSTVLSKTSPMNFSGTSRRQALVAAATTNPRRQTKNRAHPP